jgi:hypothetical protein
MQYESVQALLAKGRRSALYGALSGKPIERFKALVVVRT